MNGRMANKSRKAARRIAEYHQLQHEVRAARWRSLPWWKRLGLRIKWFFTKEARG
jgi:hypothetical protein